jgi:alpha-L-rhamnosidase
VRGADGRIGTGVLGTPFVLPALTATGHDAEAYQLLLNPDCPGWLYQIAHGATTTWERWDAIRPDGTVRLEAGAMLSFNHYAYGAVANWLYRSVAGLAPAAPGYREIRFAPRPGGGLTSAAAKIDTPYGPASIAWSQPEQELIVDLVLPAGTTGRLDPPPGWSAEPHPGDLASGEHHFVLRQSHT